LRFLEQPRVEHGRDDAEQQRRRPAEPGQQPPEATATAPMVETDTKAPTRTPDSAAKRSRCTDACTVPA
jgi:hypothetical protein